MNKNIRRASSWLWVIIFLLITGRPYETVAAPTRQPLTCAEVYTVQANDWLSKIADKFFGNLQAYPAIVVATNQQHEADTSFAWITNPDRIEVGWKLCVPITTEAETLLTEIPTLPPPLSPPEITPEVYTLDSFVNEFNFGPEVKPEWIYSSPEPPAKGEILPEHQAIHEAYGYRANYFWNEHLSDEYFITSGIFDVIPEEVKVYQAPWQTVLPRYRYPPNVTLPTGLTTNRFGWRGPQIALQKPPNTTIRIACVGASTTVGGHTLPLSYPEFLEHWLNLWSQDNGYDLNFEVINAGREGLSSNDLAAVVRYEVLPLDVDYVIYYEGSNQFKPQNIVSYPAGVTFGQPPPGLVPSLANVDSDDKTLLDELSEYSALAARARSIVEQFLITGQEPPKPEQALLLPEELDELKPDREHLGNVLALNRILRDLDHIKQNLDEQEVKMLLSTFQWFAYDGMVLDPARHRNLYGYINRVYWPITYANMRRLADLQNRVFKMWAADNGVEVIDVAELMPKQPDLYDDAIHNTHLGTRIRAWINFEKMVPLLKEDIENGVVPRPTKMNFSEHPYIKPDYQIRVLAESGTAE